MRKILEIKVLMDDGTDEKDRFDTTITMTGNPVDITSMALQAMYMLNKQFNKVLTDMPANAFWNCMVERMGERLLEESKK